VARLVGARDGLASERSYALRALPRGAIRGLTDAVLRRDLVGLARAGAIATGLSLTTAGYLIGMVSTRLATGIETGAAGNTIRRGSAF